MAILGDPMDQNEPDVGKLRSWENSKYNNSHVLLIF